MNGLVTFIKSLTTGAKHQIPDELCMNILKSPNTYDSNIPCDLVHPGRSCVKYFTSKSFQVLTTGWYTF